MFNITKLKNTLSFNNFIKFYINIILYKNIYIKFNKIIKR